MTLLEDIAHDKPKVYGAQKGVVVDVKDPLGLHRVRAQIDGVADPSTDWLYPMTSGGGSAQRGGHVVPAVGSDVVVWFHDGDTNGDGWYAAGSWGVPTATGAPEVPVDVGTDVANADQVSSWQFGALSLTIDEREGKRKLLLSDSETDDHILWDLENKQLEIVMTAGLVLTAVGMLVATALQTTINKRLVLPNQKAI